MFLRHCVLVFLTFSRPNVLVVSPACFENGMENIQFCIPTLIEQMELTTL